jgi:hypothetical protein
LHAYRATVYRVTWLRTKARADRWTEEVTLLKNEMKWTLATFQHRRMIWKRRIEYLEAQNGKKGHIAYAWREVKHWDTFINRAKSSFMGFLDVCV